MDTAVGFVKSFKNVTAKGQQFLVRSQGHGPVSPFNGFRLPNTPSTPDWKTDRGRMYITFNLMKSPESAAENSPPTPWALG
jgi:hypothetical protein